MVVVPLAEEQLLFQSSRRIANIASAADILSFSDNMRLCETFF